MVDQSNIATLSENIKQGIENRLKDVHTSMPGIIVEFNAVTQLAKVQPAIKRIFRKETTEEVILIPLDLPQLINVPVIFPRGGGFSLTFPVSPGDECLIQFCERCIDDWHETGQVKKPTSKRFHSLSDATCFVGLSSIPNKIPNYDAANTVLKKDDGQVYVRLKSNNDLDLFTAANLNSTVEGNQVTTVSGNLNALVTGEITASCASATIEATTSVDIIAPNITLDGDATVTGNLNVAGVATAPTMAASTSLTVAGVEMSGHVHSQAPDSDGDTEQNTGVPI